MSSVQNIGRLAAAVLLAAVLYPPTFSQALFEPGARAAGLGGAFVGLADDASALFYNPAALVQLDGVRAKTNLLLGKPVTEAGALPSGGSLKSRPVVFRGTMALSWKFWRRAALGIGFFTPCSLKADWPSSWPGADLCVTADHSARVYRSALSMELFRGLSLGAGLDLVRSKMYWTHDLAFPDSPRIGREVVAVSRNELSGSGRGFTASLHWKVHRAVQVGMNYMSGSSVSLSGRNAFISPSIQLTGVNVPGPYGTPIRLIEVLNRFYASQNVTARLAAPGQMTAGLLLVPFSRLSLLFDAQHTRWSEFGDWEIRSESEVGDLSPDFNSDYQTFYGIAPAYGVQSAGLKLRDAWDIKAGLEFRPGAHLAVRTGFARHADASAPGRRNPLSPGLDGNSVSLGAGYEGPLFSVYDNRQVSELSFDIYIRYGSSGAHTSGLAGHEFTYRTRAWVGGVAVGFNF